MNPARPRSFSCWDEGSCRVLAVVSAGEKIQKFIPIFLIENTGRASFPQGTAKLWIRDLGLEIFALVRRAMG
jgi:hypothetical protein